MNEIEESGNVPYTIDSKGNIVPKPYGVSRWANPRFYHCEHFGYNGCDNAAQIYYRKVAGVETNHGINESHNCCNKHGEEDKR